MRNKLMSIIFIILFLCALIIPIPNLFSNNIQKELNDSDTSNLSLHQSEEILNKNNSSSNKLKTNIKSGITPNTLTNASWYNGELISAGEKKLFIINTPFSSSNYIINCLEKNPSIMDLDIYIRFNAIPSKSKFDYKATTANQLETVSINIPENDEFGEMVILIVCEKGSGFYDVYAHYIADKDGSWRGAKNLGELPSRGSINVSTNTVNSTDIYDIFSFSVISGQQISIAFTVSTIGSRYVNLFLYDKGRKLLASDIEGYELVISYTYTKFQNGKLFLCFENKDDQKHSFSGQISDSNIDIDNSGENSKSLLLNKTSQGLMNESNYNDYYRFTMNSGDYLTISIIITEIVDFPYFDAFLYVHSLSNTSNYIKSDTEGTVLTISYYCAEFYSSEFGTGRSNNVYLRIWNAARDAKRKDSAANYTITITKYSPQKERGQLSTAPDFTIFGNNTNTKNHDLSGEETINHWYKITTKAGYMIEINVNNTSPIPYPYLFDYLLDASGTILTQDTRNNISIIYTANYTGDYYFRLYEIAASSLYESYQGISEYAWYIYTAEIDKNNNFNEANPFEINSPGSITFESNLKITDLYDYYRFEVPSGSKIELIGSSSDIIEVTLLNSLQTELECNESSYYYISYLHTSSETREFYIRIYNSYFTNFVHFNLTISLTIPDPEHNGKITSADRREVLYDEPLLENNELNSVIGDINDFYKLTAEGNKHFLAGDLLTIEITGPKNLVAQLSKKVDKNQTQIIHEKILNETEKAVIKFYPNDFYKGEVYFLRISAINVSINSYSWNITRISFDQEDGYFHLANELFLIDEKKHENNLNLRDTNDWFKFTIPSGNNVSIIIETNHTKKKVGICLFNSYEDYIFETQSFSLAINNFDYINQDCFIQITNIDLIVVNYSIKISSIQRDNDGNGLPSNAENIQTEKNYVDVVSFEDINDFYSLNIPSGYTFTLKFTSDNSVDLSLTCQLLNEHGFPIKYIEKTKSTYSFINSEKEPFRGFIQFFSKGLEIGLNYSESIITYEWNITYENYDTNGDFQSATAILSPEFSIDDQFSANITFPTHNLSDINDFYFITLEKGDMLSISSSSLDGMESYYNIYIYTQNQEIIGTYENEMVYSILISAGNLDGRYYIRFYDKSLSSFNYTANISIFSDPDSSICGAHEITSGIQLLGKMNTTDLKDIYVIDLEVGWRIKINGTLIGSIPYVNIFFNNETYFPITAENFQTEIFTLESSINYTGLLFIEFQNPNRFEFHYNWTVYVYEDENGYFSTATAIGNGEHVDSVQELDIYDYYKITGRQKRTFSISSTNINGLNLELLLFNKDQKLLDYDLEGPNLAVTFTPEEKEIFYVVFRNRDGKSGQYTFIVTGVGKIPGKSFLFNMIGPLPLWAWLSIGTGVIIIIATIIGFYIRKKKVASQKLFDF